jgi:hypothetical protein
VGAASRELAFKAGNFFELYKTFVFLNVFLQIRVLAYFVVEFRDLCGQPAPSRGNCPAVFCVFVGCSFTSAREIKSVDMTSQFQLINDLH